MKQISKRKVKQRRKKGIAKAYLSRAVAIKKLQLPLSDFRRLCILKGIYPVEPKNKSKLTGGNTRRKTYFFARDIQFLMNEPLLHKFWEFKVFMKRLTKAKGRHDYEKFKQINESKPIYQLDSMVKERYPRFIDALRDCDDALSMCFLFSMLGKTRDMPEDIIEQSRKVTLEFMHYVIHAKCLRKVFISIKGYYYQAEIMSQKITWLVPHQFVIDRVKNVDMKVMKTFTEFYITLMGFINYKLFNSIHALYPPQFVKENIEELVKQTKNIAIKKGKESKKRKRPADESEDEEGDDYKDEVVAALNKKIKIFENKSVVNADNADQQPDVFDDDEENDEDGTKKEKDRERMTVQQLMALEGLFKGLKFFLNREVPRESLTFVIRSFGGEVSWDKALYPGATYIEKDASITHQIVDRPIISSTVLGRVYIQPQWVYDCINMKILLPTSEYLIGATLPPHLSPFVCEKRGDYVPPDKVKMLNLRKQYEADKAAELRANKGEGGVDSGLDTDNEMEQSIDHESEDGDDDPEDKGPEQSKRKANVKPRSSSYGREVNPKNARKRERDSNKSNSRSKMSVKEGKIKFEDREELRRKEEAEHRKMGIMMIPKKKKRLFDRINKTQRQKSKKVEVMKAKRRIVDTVNRSRKSGNQKSR